MIEIFNFIANFLGKILSFLFNDFVIIDNPKVTFGTFIISFAFIGFIISLFLIHNRKD